MSCEKFQEVFIADFRHLNAIHKVRYIAVNYGVDTTNSHSTDYAALKNVMNEFYSRDNSRKIKAAFKARAKDGKYHAKAAPFGYLKDPADRNHLIPDPETASAVVKIYELCAQGWGNHRIRDYLRETKVPVPSWYQHIRGIEDQSMMFPDEESRYIWRPDNVALSDDFERILSTCRSRDISISIVVQDTAQFKVLFKDSWENEYSARDCTPGGHRHR